MRGVSDADHGYSVTPADLDLSEPGVVVTHVAESERARLREEAAQLGGIAPGQLDRMTQMALVAAQEAVTQAGLGPDTARGARCAAGARAGGWTSTGPSRRWT